VYKAPDGDLGNRHSSEILSLEELLKDAVTTLEIISTPGDANTVLGVKSDVSDLEYKTLVEGTGINIAHATGNITITATGGLPTLGSANEMLGVDSGATDVEYKELVEGTGINIAHATGNVTITATSGLPTLGSANEMLGVDNGASGVEYKELVEGTGINIAHATGNITIASTNGLPALGAANEILGVNNGAGDVEYKELIQGANITITHGTGNITIAAAGGGGGGGTTFEATNANVGAIVIGTPVYVSAAGSVDKAMADALATKDVVGLVVDTSIAASATGDIQTGGLLEATTGEWDAVTGDSGGLTAGTQYFVDPDTAGRLTDTAPITVGDFVCAVGIALSTTEMIIAIHQTVKQ
jgi:hypothetical protein